MPLSDAQSKLRSLTGYLDPAIESRYRDLVQAELDAFIPTAPYDVAFTKDLLEGPSGVTAAAIIAYLDRVGYDILTAVDDFGTRPGRAIARTRFDLFNAGDRMTLLDIIMEWDSDPVDPIIGHSLITAAIETGDLAFFKKLHDVAGLSPDWIAEHVLHRNMIEKLPPHGTDLLFHVIETYGLDTIGRNAVRLGSLKALALVIGQGFSVRSALIAGNADPESVAWSGEFLRAHGSAHAEMALGNLFSNPEWVLGLSTSVLRYHLLGAETK